MILGTENLILKDDKSSKADKDRIKKFKRMGDNQGNWTKQFDSIFKGNVVSGKKVLFEGFKNLAINDIENIHILSYSELNTNNIIN